MASEETKILEIKVDTSEAIKKIVAYRDKIAELKDKEKELNEQFKSGQISQQSYKEEMEKSRIKTQQYTESIRVLSKEVNNNIKQDREKSGSIKGLRAELSNLTAQYDSLSEEERNNTQIGGVLANQINETTNKIKDAEQATQRYYRNVGNYENAIKSAMASTNPFISVIVSVADSADGASGMLAQMSAGLLNVTKAALAFIATPLGAILTALGVAVTVFSKGIATSEEQMNRWKIVIAPLKVGLDGILNVITWLSDKILTFIESGGAFLSVINKLAERIPLIGGAFKEWNEATSQRIHLQKEQIRYEQESRKEVVASAEREKQIAELRSKVVDREKYSAKERREFLEEAIRLEEEQMRKRKELAELNLRNLELEGSFAENDAEMNNKIAEAREAVIKAETDYNNKVRELITQRKELSNQDRSENEAVAKSLKERADKELQAIRQMEDALTEIIKDGNERQRKEIETSYDREIEDLKKRLQEEKDLTEKAKDAILATIKAKEQAKEQELSLFDSTNTDDEFKKEYDRQRRLTQARLEATEAGSEEELALKRKINEMAMNEELRQYAEDEEMKSAIRAEYMAKDAKLVDAFKDEQLKKEKDRADKEVQIEKNKREAMRAVTSSLIGLIEAVGESNKAMAVASKVLALAQIAIDTGRAISSGVAEAIKIGFPQNIAAIAMTIATVVSNMATAIQSVKSAKFATGGDVIGAGTGTSDSIPAMLSNGESVMTAKATSMFAPILSAFNQAGGGVPINGQQTGNQTMGEDMLARAFAKGVASLPNPVVSVTEINNTARRVEVIENLNVI